MMNDIELEMMNDIELELYRMILNKSFKDNIEDKIRNYTQIKMLYAPILLNVIVPLRIRTHLLHTLFSDLY